MRCSECHYQPRHVNPRIQVKKPFTGRTAERRQASVKPLVEEYFAWVKEVLADTKVIPKGETAKGLNYSVNQEEYLKVFLTDGEVPIDDSASERALRNFTIGRKTG